LSTYSLTELATNIFPKYALLGILSIFYQVINLFVTEIRIMHPRFNHDAGEAAFVLRDHIKIILLDQMRIFVDVVVSDDYDVPYFFPEIRIYARRYEILDVL